jgi:hypothetical protein
MHTPRHGQASLFHETFSGSGGPDAEALLRSEAPDCYMLYGSPATR